MASKAAKTVDPFDAALGPVPTTVVPWQFREAIAGEGMTFGALTLTAEGAEYVNHLRTACSKRNMAVPKAVMMILTHYIETQGG